MSDEHVEESNSYDNFLHAYFYRFCSDNKLIASSHRCALCDASQHEFYTFTLLYIRRLNSKRD